jgi:hypothetical protein
MRRDERYPVLMPQPAQTDTHRRRTTLGVSAVWAVLLALAVHRASVGQSFYDDTFYAVVPWRFAHGARFLIDEMSLQSVGSMVAVPLAWAWEHTVGLTGLVLAIRLLWVGLAAIGVALCARLLRGSAAYAVAQLAAVLVLLAPPYHVFAPTYNTVSSLLLTLAALCSFAALRDRRASLASCAGIALVLAAASYPPLALASLVLLATFVLLSKDLRLASFSVLAALVTGVIVGTALFGRVSIADFGAALALGSANVASFSSPLGKMQWVFGNTAAALVSPWLWPMWALAITASVARVPARARAAAMALLPVAAALPGAALIARGEHLAFGTSAGSWLITLCAGAVLPSVLAARRLDRQDLLRLLLVAAPASAVGYVTVAYFTNSTWNRGMPAIALAPLAVGIFVCWGTSLAEEGGLRTFIPAALAALLVVFALLYATVFSDAQLDEAHVRVTHGAYAGLLTSVAHRDALDDLAKRAPRWVKPDSRVTFLGQGEAYLAVGGRPYTPAAWLYLGRGDSAGIRYIEREGHRPDVFFVNDADVEYAGGYQHAPQRDPMLRWVLNRYRRVDTAGGFGVFVPRLGSTVPRRH